MKIVLVDKSDIEVSSVTQSVTVDDDKIRLILSCKEVDDLLSFSKRFTEENTKSIYLVKDGDIVKTYKNFVISNISEQISDKNFDDNVIVNLDKDVSSELTDTEE